MSWRIGGKFNATWSPPDLPNHVAEPCPNFSLQTCYLSPSCVFKTPHTFKKEKFSWEKIPDLKEEKIYSKTSSPPHKTYSPPCASAGGSSSVSPSFSSVLSTPSQRHSPLSHTPPSSQPSLPSKCPTPSAPSSSSLSSSPFSSLSPPSPLSNSFSPS